MYTLIPTAHPIWNRTVRLSDGCLYLQKKSVIGFMVRKTRPTKSEWLRLFVGLDEGDMYLHACDNPPCVAPEHVLGGTRSENTTDMHAKGRHRTSVIIEPETAGLLRAALGGGISIRALSKALRVSERAVRIATSL
jgi:hypothetical protein